MTAISPPFVTEDEGNLTGFIFLAESHVSIHAFLDNGVAFLDIFTCRAFTKDVVVDALVEIGLTSPHTQVLERGLEYE